MFRTGPRRVSCSPSVDAIPGVGKKTGDVLRKKGFHVAADVQKTSLEKLERILGKHGIWIHEVANGFGSDELSTEHERKSIGNEQTFAQDIVDKNELQKIILSLTEELCSSSFSSSQRAHLHPEDPLLGFSDDHAGDNDRAYRRRQYRLQVDERASRDILHASSSAQTSRGPGFALGGRGTTRLQLFPEDQKRASMLTAVDRIRKKFGDNVIHVGRQ